MKNLYKKITAISLLSSLFLLYQNCSHLDKAQLEPAKPQTVQAPVQKSKKLSASQVIKKFALQKRFFQTELLKHRSLVYDFNHDGHLDLVYNNPQASALEVFIQEDGDFKLFLSLPTSAPSYSEVLAVDLNKDDQVDLVTASEGGVVNVWLQNSEQSFYERLDFNTSLGKSGAVNHISVGDVNQDGHLDLAVANTKNRLGGFVTVLLNNGLGILSLKQIMVGEGLAPDQVHLVDLDEDGFSELIFSSTKEKSIHVYDNDQGTFKKGLILSEAYDENERKVLYTASKAFQQKKKSENSL